MCFKLGGHSYSQLHRCRCGSPLLTLTIVTPGVKTNYRYPWVKIDMLIIIPGGKSWLAKSYPSEPKITLSQQVLP